MSKVYSPASNLLNIRFFVFFKYKKYFVLFFFVFLQRDNRITI